MPALDEYRSPEVSERMRPGGLSEALSIGETKRGAPVVIRPCVALANQQTLRTPYDQSAFSTRVDVH